MYIITVRKNGGTDMNRVKWFAMGMVMTTIAFLDPLLYVALVMLIVTITLIKEYKN